MDEDVPTLETFYRQFAPGLLAFLYARLKDPGWAEDVLHDVFVAFLRQARQNIQHPRAYLFSAAHRLSLNALRDRRTEKHAQAALAGTVPWRSRDGADPLEAAALNEALQGLTDDKREVLVLRSYGQMTFQEIANVLQTPLTSVFTRHRQALAALRRALEENPQTGGRS